MSNIIIGIHGLGNKPPRRILKQWWKKSIREGLKATGHPRWFFRFELIYWANVLHPKSLNPREKNPNHPRYLRTPYRPAKEFKRGEISKLRKKVREVLEDRLDRLFLNEDMSINFSNITDLIIRHYFEDLDAYYSKTTTDKHGNEHAAKDLIHERLARILRKHSKKKILLIAHSMGSIIAYDVLTQTLPDVPIDTFVTLGSPLGMPTIVSKIASAQKGRKKKKLTTPENILNKWYNFFDPEDKVALTYNLRGDYGKNTHGVQVKDKVVYNNYKNNGERNPHKSYGYLRTPEMAEVVNDFVSI